MPLTLNGTTGISFPDGSSGAPALRGTDTDTGVFFPAADTIALVEGGTEVLRINSSANVGIGTTLPNTVGVNPNSRCLSIVGDGTTTIARGTLELRNPIADASGNTLGSIYFTGGASNYAEIRAVSSGSGGVNGFGNELRFATKDDNGTISNKMFLSSVGNLGIGTTNPTEKLDVNGIVSAFVGTFGAGGYKLKYSTASADSRSWWMLGDLHAYGDFGIRQSTTQSGSTFDTKFYINPSGNIGIGTTNPNAKLTVSGDILVGKTGAATGDFISSGGGNTSSYNGLAIVSNSSSLSTQANNTLSSWIVDIGGRAADGITFNVNTADAFSIRRTAAAGSFYSASEYFRVTNTGNIGIGTTNPAYPFDVRGSSWINGASIQGATVTFGSSPITKTITISTANSDAMMIIASAYTSGGANSAVKQFIVGGYIPGSTQYAAATVSSATTGSSISISDITKANSSFSFTMTLSASLNSQGEVAIISRFPATITVT